MQEVRDAAMPQAPLCHAASGFRPLVVSLLGLWLLASASASAPAVASKFPWEDYDKRLKASQDVAALDAQLFGDSVNLQNGALSFSVTDISLPGNNGLRVELSRAYTVTNQKYAVHDEMLGDWTIQTPAISGKFAPDWISAGTPGNRCSDMLPPPVPVSSDGIQYFLSDIFNGLTLDIPGVGGGELLVTSAGATRPSSGGPYRWVTNDQIHVGCLSSIKNGTGEGFLAVGPDGTRYWFDWMAQHWEPNLKKIAYPDQASGKAVYEVTPIRRNLLLATRVEDRFGNWVTYSYSNSWNEPARLTRITAGDGRQIDLAYGTNGRVASATDGTRTWQYTYGSTPKGRITLSGVIRPDLSQWTYGFGAFSDAIVEYTESYVTGEIYRGCDWLEHPLNAYDKIVGTVTHPSGAAGTFTVGIQEHGRSNVPLSCANFTSPGNISNDDVNLFVISSHALSLEKKELSGPGLDPATWNYSYDSDIGTHMYPGTTPDWPVCTVGAQCYEPPCTSDNCAGSSRTVVTGPDDEWSRYTFGNSFRYNEGKLLKVEQGGAVAGILQTRVDTFDLSRTDKAYPARFGKSLQMNHDGFASEYHRPQLRSDTSRQSETFSWQVQADCATPGGFCMDVLARALKTRRGSTLGYARVEETAYHDNTTSWVVGQTWWQKCLTATPASDACDGDFVAEATYDPVTALPTTATQFGKLQHTLGYYADGSLKTYKDGNNNVITLSNWYRGVPRLIQYPGSVSVSATVNPDGTLASVTNEVGAKTCYAYDTMGRLASITYPSESQAEVCDTSAWNATTQVFLQINTTEYGIPAGHWRQQVSTGNGRKFVYFDALWRPLLTREYDSGNVAGTQRFVRTRHDHAGRNTFTSYPATTSNPVTGIWTEYDPLGRTTSVSQDSELGLLVTRTVYPTTAFQVTVTNPRLKPTTTSQFQAWDQPTYEYPLTLSHPESAATAIGRDAWGKPRALTRSGPGVSVTRSFDYNVHQELCRQVEPETGATLMGYDAAGNLAWSASGLPETVDCTASPNVNPILARKATRTYDARNRLLTLTFPDGLGDQIWTYTPDGLPDTITAYNNYNTAINRLGVITAYAYNARRLLAGQGETVHQENWYTWGYGYGYDANGHLAANTYPSNLTVTYAPNALGQPTQVGSYATGVSYFPNGAVKQFTYGNGVVHTLTANARGLPYRSRDVLGTAEVLDDYYDYDSNGNVTGITDAATGQGQRRNRDMTYDGLDRLKTTQSPMWGDVQASYTYDALDNLIQVVMPQYVPKPGYLAHPSRNHHYCYDGSNRLTNVKTVSCTTGSTVIGLGYDVQGNLKNKSGTEYHFDFGNRLRRVGTNLDTPSQVLTETYRYDGLGRRVQSQSPSSGLRVLSQYSREGKLVYQYDTRVSERIDYLYLGNRLVATRTRPISTAVYTTEYQHTDALGSPAAVTDANGVVLRRDEYEPYGKRLNRANDNRPGYTGHVMDEATGLTYMQQRYYDPGIGMFLSVDPVTAHSDPVGQFNRYRYSNNNPYKFTDPDGRDAIYFTDTRTLVYPVYFTGTGASPELIGEIEARVNSLQSVDTRVDRVVLQVLDAPGGPGTNVMDLSPGTDNRYGKHGEGVHGGQGGRYAHIDSSRTDAAGAATHDINHFGGAPDGYVDIGGTGADRSVVNARGYTDQDIMGRNTSGDRLTVEDVTAILENDTTYKFEQADFQP